MLEALVDLAQTQIGALIARGGNLDVQALGLVGLDAALSASVVAAQSSLGHAWWVPLPGLFASAIAGGSVMAVSRFDLGPSPGEFYVRHRAKHDLAALAQLLSDLDAAREHNARPLTMKTKRLQIALGLLIGTIVYAAAIITS
jgi:hypothetical protein